jgi:hypothetical protein
MFARQQSAGRSFAGFASFMSWSKRKQTSLDWKKQKRELPILLKMPPVGYSINMEVLATLVEQSGVQRETNSRTKKAI